MDYRLDKRYAVQYGVTLDDAIPVLETCGFALVDAIGDGDQTLRGTIFHNADRSAEVR